MPLASISKIHRGDASGMRSTEAQDRAVEPGRRWLRDRRVWWASGVLFVVLLAAGAWGIRGWATSDATVARERVRIATVTRGKFVNDVAAQATVVAAVSPELHAPAAGTVTLSVKAGDAVKKGGVLATVDSPALRNEYERERATLESLTVDLKREEIDVRRRILQSQQERDMAAVAIRAAEREFARSQLAWDQKVISERDYRRAKDELDEAKLTHDHAVQASALDKESLEFELQTRRLQRERQQLVVADLERRVGELAVRSPVDGMVGSVAVTDKAAVQQDAVLLNVVDLSALEIEFRVAESYAGSLGTGMPAEISYGGKTYAGEVAALSPEVRQGEVTGRVRFKGEPPAGLRQNQRVSVRIVMDERDGVLKVERGGFYEAGGGRLAYVVRDGVAERAPIQTGAASIREIEITGGLAEGDQVVVSDTEPFKNAARVLLPN
ncbi:MAG TPA: efflux RND transporter periplasmic adaptor subunit [Steroidobacteraceae bacterium]|nr:efflux RND transporter periplasmic adaptor subunit [Steroidobacteraceae bacterium]HQR49096.1 efflux RND transporter periplasmic adaptor subunit [Steroidobacteraceae bacterium]